MRRTVNPNWIKLLWNRLEEIAHERERPLELRMQWPDNADVWFEVRVSNGKPRAVIDDRVIALLDRIDKDELLRRLVQENQRASWPTNTAAIRAARGNTIGLTLATSNIAAPLAGRTTLNVDIYQSLKIDKQSLRPLLPAEVMSKVNAETRLLTLRRLGELLGIPVFKEDVPSDGRKQTAAVASRDGAPDEDDSDEDDALEDDADDESSPVWRSRNVIFFGPPGTGKSHRVDELVRNHLGVKSEERILRITFHPEYSYFDFVGNYRPAVGWLPTNGARFSPEISGAPARTDEPRVYYVFDPGPLSLAVKAAAWAPDENVVLIIEEINRGNCAAIFGDVFQLLDRKSNPERADEFGVSQYPITPSGSWMAWLDGNLPKESPAWRNGQLRLPRNLFIYATMNTSDQSLFPMDTAFRRRWNMEYHGIDSADPPTLVPVQHDRYVRWADLMRPLNRAIVEHTRTDDKQVGPWFVRARDRNNRVERQEFAAKVLFYLWSEVFRDAPEKLFRAEIETYDQLVRTYLDEKSLVFNDNIVVNLTTAGLPGGAASKPPGEALALKRAVAAASD